MGEPQDGLSIGELANRTDVRAATLRSWEGRYGFPVPRRLTGGHRRYEMGDIALIQDVLRLRASGMSLAAAISQVTTLPTQAEPSVFALRRRHPSLAPQVLRKATLLALTRAIEDECCARAEYAVLFASFQSERKLPPIAAALERTRPHRPGRRGFRWLHRIRDVGEDAITGLPR